ncbi:MAG: hypothetical protein ACMVO3_25120, partial [Thalassobaculum sp.]
ERIAGPSGRELDPRRRRADRRRRGRSAIGFLRAPVSCEVVRSRYLLLAEFDAASVDRLLLRHGRRGPGDRPAPAAAGWT